MLLFLIGYGFSSRAAAEKVIPHLARAFCRSSASYTVVAGGRSSAPNAKKERSYFQIVCNPLSTSVIGEHEAKEADSFVHGLCVGMNLAKRETIKAEYKRAKERDAKDMADCQARIDSTCTTQVTQ